MRTKATSLSIRSEQISVFKFALEYQKIDPYKRLELQTKELSTRSFSCSSSFEGSLTQFLVRSFSPVSTRRTVYVSGFRFLVFSVVPPLAQLFLLFMSINML